MTMMEIFRDVANELPIDNVQERLKFAASLCPAPEVENEEVPEEMVPLVRGWFLALIMEAYVELQKDPKKFAAKFDKIVSEKAAKN